MHVSRNYSENTQLVAFSALNLILNVLLLSQAYIIITVLLYAFYVNLVILSIHDLFLRMGHILRYNLDKIT